MLASSLSKTDSICGAIIFLPSDEVSITKAMQVKTQITCAAPIEHTYYAADLGSKDLCALCATENANVLQNLKKKFKIVLLICMDCLKDGKEPVCQDPLALKVKIKCIFNRYYPGVQYYLFW